MTEEARPPEQPEPAFRAGPRADFECQRCARTIPDLPISARRCPYCGRARGFRRLYNAVQISLRRQTFRQIDQALAPQAEAHAQARATASTEQQRQREAVAAMWERAAPEERQHLDSLGLRPDRPAGPQWLKQDEQRQIAPLIAQLPRNAPVVHTIERLRVVPDYGAAR